MNSFLKDLAFHLHNQYQKQLADLTLVFPNRRAGLFFRKSLAEIVQKPVWAPQIVSMEDFVKTYSDLQVADSISLIFLLYDEYVKVNPQVESFDRFFSWGEIMLKDFDDIDKYLINSNHLFTSVKEQKLMEEKFDYLTNEQKQVIKSFWSSFGDKISSQQQGFLKIWDLLPVIYKSFQQRLLNEKLAYEGLLYKDVVQKCTDNIISHKRKKIIFAGFNSLSTSEELIIKYFIKSYGADIFWDVDKSYMENVNLEAGTFLRKYAKDKIFAPSFPSPLPDRLNKDKEK
ncbi:MAG: PD-(D/E)XK nuclease family protein, partial [Bacteroidota bacterium]|nr:PD-(D/E)XK nuclease family protein [Bacteroidota bacterium]